MTMMVDLTDQELAELKEVTRESDATAAIRTAMIEYVRYVRRLRLKELSGKVEMEENWQALEQIEQKATAHEPQTGTD